MKEGSSSASTMCGEASVVLRGVTQKPLWSVTSWDSWEKVTLKLYFIVSISISVLPSLGAQAVEDVYGRSTGPTYMSYVRCKGAEETIMDCSANGLGEYCFRGHAAVQCARK